MLAAAKLMAFLATSDGRRARAFYETTLGLRVTSDDDFALALDAGGATLRVQKVERVEPHPYTALGWEVPDIGDALEALTARGVRFMRYPGMTQDPRGVWRSPSGASIAWFTDPDGNVLSLTQLESR
jgi:catechol 2,3-dioxygenase-like lactoylglutathione lyase family enzyme